MIARHEGTVDTVFKTVKEKCPDVKGLDPEAPHKIPFDDLIKEADDRATKLEQEIETGIEDLEREVKEGYDVVDSVVSKA